ncbi:MAG: hypothetical protein ACLQME_20350 [Alphaproteobacteria bacterium]
MILARLWTAFKIIGGCSLVIVVALGLDYCDELPKYHFDRVTSQTEKEIPGARLIKSFKTWDFDSPLTWFWPPTIQRNYAIPFLVDEHLFVLFTLNYEESPTEILIDTHCKSRTVDLYSLNAPASAFPARDWSGRPVVANDGRTYRLAERNASLLKILDEAEVHALCDTDWTAERNALADAARAAQP